MPGAFPRPSQAPHEHDRTPYRLRIGVTGHRRLEDEEALAQQVRRVLRRIRELVPEPPHAQVLLTVVSPLAEGADRLIAEEVLKIENADLVAPLPLPREEYIQDFESAESKREFEGLLSQAKEVVDLDRSGSGEGAYERVGKYVVDHCDVLVAIWDGKESRGRGGTANIIEYARQLLPQNEPSDGRRFAVQCLSAFLRLWAWVRQRPLLERMRQRAPLIWISTENRHEITEELGEGIDLTPLRQLHE